MTTRLQLIIGFSALALFIPLTLLATQATLSVTPAASQSAPTAATPHVTPPTPTVTPVPPYAPDGLDQQGPVRLCSLDQVGLDAFAAGDLGCPQGLDAIPPDSSTAMMSEEYVYLEGQGWHPVLYLWQLVAGRWLLWSRVTETFIADKSIPAGGADTPGLSNLFYDNSSCNPTYHSYQADIPPQDCGDQYMVVITRGGVHYGQVPFTISC